MKNTFWTRFLIANGGIAAYVLSEAFAPSEEQFGYLVHTAVAIPVFVLIMWIVCRPRHDQ